MAASGNQLKMYLRYLDLGIISQRAFVRAKNELDRVEAFAVLYLDSGADPDNSGTDSVREVS